MLRMQEEDHSGRAPTTKADYLKPAQEVTRLARSKSQAPIGPVDPRRPRGFLQKKVPDPFNSRTKPTKTPEAAAAATANQRGEPTKISDINTGKGGCARADLGSDGLEPRLILNSGYHRWHSRGKKGKGTCSGRFSPFVPREEFDHLELHVEGKARKWVVVPITG